MKIEHQNMFASVDIGRSRLSRVMSPSDVAPDFEKDLHALIVRDGIKPVAAAIINLVCDHNRMQKTLQDLSSAAATMASASTLVHEVIENRTHRAHLPAGVSEDKKEIIQ